MPLMKKPSESLSDLRSLPSAQRAQQVVVWLIRLSMLVAIILTLSFGDWENFFLSILALGLSFIPEMIESRYKVVLPLEFEIVIVVFIYAAVLLGEATNIYEKVWWWDLFLHTSSGLVLSFAAYLFLYSLYRRALLQAKPGVIAFLVFMISLGLAAVWEIFEFSMDTFFGTTMQVGSLKDTMTDMIVATIGGLLVAVISYRQIITPRQENLVGLLTRKFFHLNPSLSPHEDDDEQQR